MHSAAAGCGGSGGGSDGNCKTRSAPVDAHNFRSPFALTPANHHQSINGNKTTHQVWRPGVDPVADGEELDYDPTAYDCLHRFALEWPCLSFDVVRDGLGGPRAAFPHTVFMVAGTQAAQPRQNTLAVLKLAALGQGRHGKRDGKRRGGGGSDDDDDESSSSSDDDGEGGSGSDSEMDASDEPEDREPPARLHHRLVALSAGVNRVRAMPQRPGVVAVWTDNKQVKVYDVTPQLEELAAEEQLPVQRPPKVQVRFFWPFWGAAACALCVCVLYLCGACCVVCWPACVLSRGSDE